MNLDTLALPMIFVGGLLGSSHCIGMCGGFVVTIGSGTTSWRENLARQLAYSAGRLFTYSSIGALLGVTGRQLSGWLPALSWGQALLSILAGLLLIAQGLRAAGWWPGRGLRSSTGGCPWASSWGALLRTRQVTSVFLAGVLTGLLPCGLLYAYFALAASTRSLTLGGMTMLAFGAGTLPLMLLTGLGTGAMNLLQRRRLLRVAAWCVVVTGLLTVSRGVWYVVASDSAERPSCPLCQPNSSDIAHVFELRSEVDP